MEEAPIDLEEQRKLMKAQINYVENKISKKAAAYNILPFNIAPIEYIHDKIESSGLGEFIDPEFPPTEHSLYDTHKKSYPLE